MPDQDLLTRLFVIVLLILSTACHEMAHAFTATWFGDPTPGRNGRLTLNPIPHLDPLWTAVVLPLVMFLSHNGLMILAQTPINPSRFRHPLRDHALVAAAGPAVNFFCAALAIGTLWIPGMWNTAEPHMTMIVLLEVVEWSVILGLFNLLPIPPLDGYWIIRSVLPLSIRTHTDQFARSGYGMIVVFLLGGAMVAPLAGPVLGFIMANMLPQAY